MPFTPGDPNINRSGRPKGSRNHVTKVIEEQFGNVLENRLPDLERWINQTAQENPAKAADLLMRLSERFLPLIARTEITGKDGEDLFKDLKFDFGDEPKEDSE
jgi:hypothetical protein